MVRITPPNVAGAKTLAQALIGAVGAERVSLDAQSGQVCVDEPRDNEGLVRVLGAVERWLDELGIEAVRVENGERTYYMERRERAGAPR